MSGRVPFTAMRARSRAGRPSLPRSREVEDARFRNLLDPEEWSRLPSPIQRRFTHALADGESSAFLGEVAETRLSLFGRLISCVLLLFGAPLPLQPAQRTSAAVIVTEDHASGGQLWTRIYGRIGRFPQVIHSAKCFSGPTGLEERVGGGLGMALTVHVEHRALVFRSAWYFLRVLGLTLRVPSMLSPGRLEVVHREERDGCFSFTLTIHHPLFGEVVRQAAFFKDGPR
ncbi:MAG TPA: DUF4166 domain-containing protein [Steroidobacteraceae bacterium]